jgi:hypothetical protein
MNKSKNKHNKGQALQVSLLWKEGGNIMKMKTSNQIVEALKSKGIHAEVCKRQRS